MKTKAKLFLALSILVLMGAIGFAIFSHQQEKTANANLVKTDRALQASKKANIDLISEKQPDIVAAKNAFNQLVQIDWNLPDQEALDKRPSRMAPLVTSEVQKKSLDFASDPDKMLEQANVSATVDHLVFIPTSQSGDTVTAKAMVFVQASRDGGAPGMVRFAYNLAYDVGQKKISLLDRIGTYKVDAGSHDD
ncbi:hypothetical protein [Fructobacillus tropaeoli]|uniref:hypothetical protein n=1 Tax=Fructobacillus tropaeoli TaxID=709323 RepID=UPI002D85F03B|nr:hypothetical protein LMG30238_FMBOGHMB_01599 [Fructobacillus tropaeoli]